MANMLVNLFNTLVSTGMNHLQLHQGLKEVITMEEGEEKEEEEEEEEGGGGGRGGARKQGLSTTSNQTKQQQQQQQQHQEREREREEGNDAVSSSIYSTPSQHRGSHYFVYNKGRLIPTIADVYEDEYRHSRRNSFVQAVEEELKKTKRHSFRGSIYSEPVDGTGAEEEEQEQQTDKNTTTTTTTTTTTIETSTRVYLHIFGAFSGFLACTSDLLSFIILEQMTAAQVMVLHSPHILITSMASYLILREKLQPMQISSLLLITLTTACWGLYMNKLQEDDLKQATLDARDHIPLSYDTDHTTNWASVIPMLLCQLTIRATHDTFVQYLLFDEGAKRIAAEDRQTKREATATALKQPHQQQHQNDQDEHTDDEEEAKAANEKGEDDLVGNDLRNRIAEVPITTRAYIMMGYEFLCNMLAYVIFTPAIPGMPWIGTWDYFMLGVLLLSVLSDQLSFYITNIFGVPFRILLGSIATIAMLWIESVVGLTPSDGLSWCITTLLMLSIGHYCITTQYVVRHRKDELLHLSISTDILTSSSSSSSSSTTATLPAATTTLPASLSLLLPPSMKKQKKTKHPVEEITLEML